MNKIFIHFLLFAVFGSIASAGLPVTDSGLIATNKANATRDYAEQLLHEVNQQAQILRLAKQIQQLDNYLERFGNPATVAELKGLDQLEDLLRLPQSNRRSDDLISDLDGAEVFENESVYRSTPEEVVLDGETVGERDTQWYKPEAAANRSLEHYREVRSSVLQRREIIRAEIAQAMAQVRNAQTSSEVQKISVVMTGLKAELDAIDREMEFAASEATARMFQNEVQRKIERKAEVEASRAKLREGTRRDAETYRLVWPPVLFNFQG